ncbi:MAG: AAA family ATPase [Erysipelotrichaceae bacterium]|nr:AAA family ATPase [Erysipelotrichaceae bacterium]
MKNTKEYQIIKNVLKDKESFIIAIDGMCGSGKSTLAKLLSEDLKANVVSIDYFYLPFKYRKENWMDIIAGNIDFDRFNKDIIKPYFNKENYTLYQYNHSTDDISFISNEQFNPRLIIEGSYSLHPLLINNYDYKIFVECDKDIQLKRLSQRENINFDKFVSIWIPKEDKYHMEMNVKEKADITIDSSFFF